MTISTQADDRLVERMEQQEQLLPGLADEITLKEIVRKLTWREFYVLARVSRGWHNAIRNRQVYDARVGSSLTDTFIIVDCMNKDGPCRTSLRLWSLRDNYWLDLPGVPHFHEGNPWFNSIVVDGKVYILGNYSDNPCGRGGTVYVLDLAGQRLWTQCAYMQIPRDNFGCGSMDGKIYVFGGTTKNGYCFEVEVFDPKENRWSVITLMPVSRYLHKVVAVGEELVVYGGYTVKRHTDQFCRVECPVTYVLEIYNPVKDEWRTVSDAFGRAIRSHQRGDIFVAQGKLHLMNQDGVHVQNFDGNSCTELYSDSLILGAGSSPFNPDSIVVADNEIIAKGVFVYLVPSLDSICNVKGKDCLLRSRGFGSEKKELAWQEVGDWPSKEFVRFMHAFQL